MKKVMCIVLSFMLLLGITPLASASRPEVCVLMPYATKKCTHEFHIRTTENVTQYVYQNESVHLVQEVFTAVCANCGKDEQTIIDSQIAEAHTWMLEYEFCNHATGMHEYIYKCACKTNSFEVRCTGNHAIIAQEGEAPTERE